MYIYIIIYFNIISECKHVIHITIILQTIYILYIYTSLSIIPFWSIESSLPDLLGKGDKGEASGGAIRLFFDLHVLHLRRVGDGDAGH